MKTLKKIFGKKENEQETTLSSTGVQEEQLSRQVPPPLPPTPPELPPLPPKMPSIPELNHDVFTYRFYFNNLSAEFLNQIGYNKQLEVHEQLVGNGNYVKKGDDLLILCEKTYFRTSGTVKGLVLQANMDGYIRFIRQDYFHKLTDGDTLYEIYKDKDLLLDKIYPIRFVLTKDDFTGTQIVKQSIDDMDAKGMRMNNIYISLVCNNGNHSMLIKYESNNCRIKKNYKIYILLGNQEVLKYTIHKRPVNDKPFSNFSVSVTQTDLEKMRDYGISYWRIYNDENVQCYSGRNICANKLYDDYLSTEDIHNPISRKYVKKYLELAKSIEVVQEKNVEEDKDDNNFRNQPCYLYLMVDTTNNFHKIGISNKPKYREHTLQSDKPTIELVTAKKFPTRPIAEAFEAALHKTYDEKRIRGEWFNLNEEDVENIKETLK